MDGSSVVLHTRFSSVVFPAFALPITRMRKRVYLAWSFIASSGSIVTAAGGGTGATGGSATGGHEGVGGGKEAGGGTVTGWGKRTDVGAVTTGRATTVEGEFERLGGVLCDPSPKTFFSRLRSPLDFSTVCWRLSAISMRVGDRVVCELSGLCKLFVTPDLSTHDNSSGRELRVLSNLLGD